MKRNYYAFCYLDNIHTTWGEDNRIAGDIYKFDSKKERDKFVTDMHYSLKNNLKPCTAINRKDISRMGHGDFFNENIA